MQQLGQAMVGLRPDHDVDERRPLEHRPALGLGDAAGDPDHQIAAGGAPPRAQLTQPAELRINLLGGLLADVAGVQDDQVGVVRAIDPGIAVRRQRVGHARRIVHVHLAAVGLDEELFRHASAAADCQFKSLRQSSPASTCACAARPRPLPGRGADPCLLRTVMGSPEAHVKQAQRGHAQRRQSRPRGRADAGPGRPAGEARVRSALRTRRDGRAREAWCRGRSSLPGRCAAGHSSARPWDSRPAASSACGTPPASCRSGSSDAA